MLPEVVRLHVATDLEDHLDRVPTELLGMLVHQAARQFTLWTGLDAPVAAMRAATASVQARSS